MHAWLCENPTGVDARTGRGQRKRDRRRSLRRTCDAKGPAMAAHTEHPTSEPASGTVRDAVRVQ